MRNRRSQVLAFVGVCVLINAWAARAQTIDASYRADVQKLIEVTGGVGQAQQFANLVLQPFWDAIKKAQPSIPDRALEITKQVLSEELVRSFSATDGLSDQTVVIYSRHFTHDEVRGLLAFYSTDLGRKVIASMPAVFQESAAAGQKWMEQQLPRIQKVLEERFRAEGLIGL